MQIEFTEPALIELDDAI